MNYTNNKRKSSFPDPLASTDTKKSNAYGLEYAKAIESQWGKMTSATSLYGKEMSFLKGVEITQTALRTPISTKSF